MKHSALLNDLLHRIGEIRDQIGEAWPYHADPETGIWETVDDGDWCGGHWVECVWIKGVLEGKADLIEEARERTEIPRPKLEKDDQFRGHRFYYSAARIYAQTGDQVPAWDFDDPDGPVDTSASAIVLEQLARMRVENDDAAAQEFTKHIDPMIDGLMPYVKDRGRLVGGCFNQPKKFANKNELIWGTAYLLMSLHYLEEKRVIC